MTYLLDNKEIDISKLQDKGSGKEGTVYQYGTLAIKIYKKTFLDKATCKYLIRHHGKTKQIILPQSMILNINNKYSGYATKFLGESDGLCRLCSYTKEEIKENYKVLQEDASILASLGILLNDIDLHNMIVRDKIIYFPDSGLFVRMNPYKYQEYLKLMNKKTIDELFTSIILDTYLDYGVAPYQLFNYLNINFYNKDGIEYHDFYDRFISSIDTEETIIAYSKRIKKEFR